VPPPPNSKAGSAYTRFIPREELQDFASWRPGSFGDAGAVPGATGATSPTAVPASAEVQAQLHAARQAGYQDGYRDGLVALESFKRSFAQQSSAQIGALLSKFRTEFDGLEQTIAAKVARVATELARQVVRSEIATRPECIVAVAQQAMQAVLASARQIVVHVHPDDQALVQQGAAQALASCGARLVANEQIERGSCRVESDVGSIDACIATRWAQAERALGVELPWQAGDPSCEHEPGTD
jgi:flagellar assembly protein FliH